MIPRTDLFHQVVYKDSDYTVVADHTEMFPSYNVYVNKTGKWIGGTNGQYYMGSIRAIMNWYNKYYLRYDNTEEKKG